MASIFKQGQTQILVIGDHRADYYIWSKNRLAFVDQFNINESGYYQFAKHLDEHPKLSLIIITDLIDEGFRNENIVHVSSTDRRALLERKLNYTFRNTSYRYARVTGREIQGRKDDNILLSAITKPELIKPWTDIAQDKKVQTQSITSFPYTLESYIQNSEHNKEPYLLIANLDDDLKLRQTFFNNGKILFSRSITLSSKDSSSISNDLYQESLRIRRYLERIRVLHFENTLKLVIYSRLPSQELDISTKTSDMMLPEFYNIDNEVTDLNIRLGKHEPNSIMLFLAEYLQRSRIENVYAPAKDRSYYHLNLAGKAMVALSVFSVILTVVMNLPVLIDSYYNWDQMSQLEARTTPLNREYEQLTQRFPETPIPSKEMALVVETAETIQQQAYAPSSLLNLIAQALQSSPELELSQIDWSLTEDKIEIDPQYGIIPIDLDPSDNFQTAVLEERTTLEAEISGLAFSTNSYREAQEQVLDFIDALQSLSGVTVTPLRMPTDVRVDTSVTTIVGDGEVSAIFTLALTFQD